MFSLVLAISMISQTPCPQSQTAPTVSAVTVPVGYSVTYQLETVTVTPLPVTVTPCPQDKANPCPKAKAAPKAEPCPQAQATTACEAPVTCQTVCTEAPRKRCFGLFQRLRAKKYASHGACGCS